MAAVPNLPGVPALLTGYSAVLGTVSLITSDLIALGLISGPQWGIFDEGGNAVVTADTVIDLNFRQDWSIADFPMAGGSFASYNKVITPFDVRLRFVAGGSAANRNALLASIDAIAGDTNLYSVVTPEKTYQNCNVKHQGYARATQNGLGILVADVWLQQIRIAAAATRANNTASPGGAPQVNGGNPQPQAPTPFETSVVDSVS